MSHCIDFASLNKRSIAPHIDDDNPEFQSVCADVLSSVKCSLVSPLETHTKSCDLPIAVRALFELLGPPEIVHF